jgi:hypothetical protein
VLSTLLTLVPWLAFSVLVATVVVGPFAGAWLAGRPRTTTLLLGVAVLAVVALTLYPDGAPRSTVTCTAGLPYLAPTAVESIANVLLFVPVSFLAGVLWRRPVVAVLGAAALSAAVELVQALVLVIGRACDTSDWITNVLGAVVGGVLATGALAWRRHRTRRAGVQPS